MGSTSKKVRKTRKRTFDANNNEKEAEGEEKRSKVNWTRIALLGFITSIIFVVINIIIIIIIIGLGFDNLLAIQDISQYLFFGEVGFIVFLGACVGNFGQSIALTNIKARLFKSAPMSKDSFREATFNSFTYYIAATLLLVYLMVMIQILKLIEYFG